MAKKITAKRKALFEKYLFDKVAFQNIKESVQDDCDQAKTLGEYIVSQAENNFHIGFFPDTCEKYPKERTVFFGVIEELGGDSDGNMIFIDFIVGWKDDESGRKVEAGIIGARLFVDDLENEDGTTCLCTFDPDTLEIQQWVEDLCPGV